WNDQQNARRFREETSAAIAAKNPSTRVFYNAGHLPKLGIDHFAPYSHFEVESLPTGGWGYDHFPSTARYVVPLGVDTMGQTGKF
ncbi:hypothetical protein, partial [Escherichia coli]|uniref:hypothetical protein n=1 Tax=Escherichia coli TaxID=562 RepID=UPI001AA0EDF5